MHDTDLLLVRLLVSPDRTSTTCREITTCSEAVAQLLASHFAKLQTLHAEKIMSADICIGQPHFDKDRDVARCAT